MNDPLRVRRLQCIGNLKGEVEHRFWLEGLSFDAMPERLPFQQLQGDERLPVVLVNVVDRADVRMIERRNSLCFANGGTLKCAIRPLQKRATPPAKVADLPGEKGYQP